MADINIALQMLTNVWHETTIFSIYWILNVVATIITAWIITNNPSKMPILLLPVSIMWHIVGLRASIYMYVIFAIIFVIKAFSYIQEGNILRTHIRKGYQESGYIQKRNTYTNLNQKRNEKRFEKAYKTIENMPDITNSTLYNQYFKNRTPRNWWKRKW